MSDSIIGAPQRDTQATRSATRKATINELVVTEAATVQGSDVVTDAAVTIQPLTVDTNTWNPNGSASGGAGQTVLIGQTVMVSGTFAVGGFGGGVQTPSGPVGTIATVAEAHRPSADRAGSVQILLRALDTGGASSVVNAFGLGTVTAAGSVQPNDTSDFAAVDGSDTRQWAVWVQGAYQV